MKKFIVLYFCLFGVSFLGAQNNKNLSLYVSFDDCGAQDVTGSGNVAQLNGAPECVCGVKGKALKFDGLDDNLFIVGTVLDVLAGTDFTLSFYFKPLVNVGNQVILSKRENCDNGKGISINYSLTSNTITVLLQESATERIVLTSKLDLTKCWQHVVVQRNTRTHRLFLNGIQAASGVSAKRLIFKNNEPINVATGPCPNEILFKGTIDELRVYNSSLSEKSVKELYIKPDQITNFDTLIYLGGTVNIGITNTCATSFAWKPAVGVADPTQALTTLSPPVTTTYKLEFNSDGCVSSDTLLVKVVDPASLTCSDIYLPNAFTPNGDNLNDDFGISNPFIIQVVKSFDIFDSWGGKIFTTNDVTARWDGKIKGEPANPGVYLYRVIYDCNNKELTRQGSITLLK